MVSVKVTDKYMRYFCMGNSIFKQLKEGKTELTFGFSEGRVKANNEVITEYFNRMNP